MASDTFSVGDLTAVIGDNAAEGAAPGRLQRRSGA